MNDPRRPVAVIGAGAWGTALAIQVTRAGGTARLWVFEPELLDLVRHRGENPWYLPGIHLPSAVQAVGSLAEAVKDADVVILAVPSHVLRGVARDLAPHLSQDAVVVSAAKGLEEQGLLRMTEVLANTLPSAIAVRTVALSGPTFALEVAQSRPTAAVLASPDAGLARMLQRLLASPTFRLYTQTDVVGVELGGALKNVLAIAAGIADGLELGANARAALLTRGLAEMARLGVALGARAQTFAGLAGLGDLVLTCTGGLSRNRRLGLALAGGQTLEQWQAGTRSIAEGVRTSRAAVQLAQRAGVVTPIFEEVATVLFDGKPPRAALGALLAREARPEEEPDDLLARPAGSS